MRRVHNAIDSTQEGVHIGALAPLWGPVGARGLQMGAVYWKMLSVICSNEQFLTQINQLMVTKFSPNMSNYTQQKFRLWGSQTPDWGASSFPPP